MLPTKSTSAKVLARIKRSAPNEGTSTTIWKGWIKVIGCLQLPFIDCSQSTTWGKRLYYIFLMLFQSNDQKSFYLSLEKCCWDFFFLFKILVFGSCLTADGPFQLIQKHFLSNKSLNGKTSMTDSMYIYIELFESPEALGAMKTQ